MKENESIGYEIKILENIIERKIISESKINERCLVTLMQGKILGYLFKNKDTTIYQKDIEKTFKIRRSTASGVLQTMEKNGLIIRADSSEDARSKKIILTETSIQKGKEIKNKMINFEKMLRKDIEQNDIDIFFKVINKVKNNILEQEGK